MWILIIDYFKDKKLDYCSPLPRFDKAIIYDAICNLSNDSIWTSYNNIGMCCDNQTDKPTLFSDKDELYRINERILYTRRYDLPKDWQEILENKYLNIKFVNYPDMANEVHIDSDNVE